MPTYGMGEAIRTMRIRSGYTQEELAYGICSTGTLSKIENGRSVTSKKVFEALSERMPGLHHACISCDTETEMRRSKLCKRTLLYLELRKMKEAKRTMAEYWLLEDEKNPFCKQFALYTQAIYQAIKKEREEEVLPKLEKALEQTMPNYKDLFHQTKRMILLTYDEIYILSNMGIAYGKMNKTEKALQILYYLKCYIERQKLDMTESLKVYPMILGNFAWLLERQGRFEEAERQCDTGIDICLATGKYTILPHLLCTKAWCLAASGNLMMAKKSRMQAQTILDITEQYCGYGSFREFYKAREPIYITF